MFAGTISFLYAWSASEEETKQLPKPPRIVTRLSFTLLLGIGFIAAGLQTNITSGHPIDLLIAKGREQHNNFLAQAHASNSLEEAVTEYKRRYKIPPPPGFDKWYEYASSRASPIIDDFDQIYSDLLPFREFTPQKLRELTHQMATNPANNIGAVSVRNGTSIPQQGVWPSHAWMVSAIATMIEPFAKYLPDMDIAFNLDDQPRVAVPWESISAIRDAAQSQAHQDLVLNIWSKDRSSRWAPLQPVDQTRKTSFSNNDGLRVFDKYVRDLCPPSSQTRTSRIWDRFRICLSCVLPHSTGQFVSDWDLANDICHQPDLAELHGVFSGPTGFVVSRELLPVFSQSSISGFSDILYPSPWNYVDNVKYEPSESYPDPDYNEKENTLFWIGSTSEGMGSKERWKGLARQRFTHLVNNNTESQISLFLPNNGPNNYTYQILDGSAPTRDLGLQTNVHVTGPIKHCGECDTQTKELGTATRVEFQSNWQYRYLFDLDGAGFSGRFLPFLQSRSLLFKAGIFRQWFDSRITPWLHFVPVDLRLHGMWSTLAYFAGVNGTILENQGAIFSLFAKSRRVEVEGHHAEGRHIAEEGRKWAEQAVRKEDMEIYFFRLLLEWGRLTDDHRDVLGFKFE
ncbi:capsular associated protein [Aspergillus sclerotialis]|uniref:Capsular associated protein n=1 Tax=Aspergillus sclerotialis TaxID=2070753 RepID=A0A3A2ZD57_9EURO|nr:capsular associated protein [Aspergillus sclerotialis]